LRKHWWVLFLIFVGVLTPAYLFTAAMPPAYQSQARMWLTGKLSLGEGRLYTEELVNFLGTQADLLRSSVIQARALAKVQKQFSAAPAPEAKDAAAAQFKALPGSADSAESVRR